MKTKLKQGDLIKICKDRAIEEHRHPQEIMEEMQQKVAEIKMMLEENRNQTKAYQITQKEK